MEVSQVSGYFPNVTSCYFYPRHHPGKLEKVVETGGLGKQVLKGQHPIFWKLADPKLANF